MPPRTDGVYLLRERDGDSYIRFLPDGSVITAATTGEEAIQDVVEWLQPGPTIAAAPVTVDGDRVEWTERMGEAADDVVEYRGTCTGDQLVVDERARNPPWLATDRRYAFISEDSVVQARTARSAKRAERSAQAKAARAAKKSRS